MAYFQPFTDEELIEGAEAMIRGESLDRWRNKIKDLTVEQRLQWDADIERRFNEWVKFCKENEKARTKLTPSD
jgi:hypothetical protein